MQPAAEADQRVGGPVDVPGRGTAARASGAAPRRWPGGRSTAPPARAQPRLQAVECPLGVAEAVLGVAIPDRNVGGYDLPLGVAGVRRVAAGTPRGQVLTSWYRGGGCPSTRGEVEAHGGSFGVDGFVASSRTRRPRLRSARHAALRPCGPMRLPRRHRTPQFSWLRTSGSTGTTSPRIVGCTPGTPTASDAGRWPLEHSARPWTSSRSEALQLASRPITTSSGQSGAWLP